MAAASTGSGCTFFPATASLSSSSSSSSSSSRRLNSLFSTNFFKHIPSSSPRLVISQSKFSQSRCRRRLAAVARLGDNSSETYPDAEATNSNSNSNSVSRIDTKLPRRSLLVQFTCVECGERTQRLINRLAYEKGTVYVQCAGCEQYHKLVDNLGLVIEYDLREETTDEMDTEQVP